MNNEIWYLQIFRSNFFAEPRILRLNKELLTKPEFTNGLYNYLHLCMIAVEGVDHSIEYDLDTLDIILGYDDIRITVGFIELLIKCKLAIIINNKLELYLSNSTILSKKRYEEKKLKTTQRREEYKNRKAKESIATLPQPIENDIDKIPF